MSVSANWDSKDFINQNLFRSDISVAESQNLYKDWAQSQKYDSMISQRKIYSSLLNLQKALSGLHEQPQNARVLDVGAGTGLTAEVLIQEGYKNIDGLEPQRDLANAALKKNLYQRIVCEFITADKTKGLDENSYDLIACTGAFAPGHIPAAAMKEMVRVTKPGGFIIICMREEFLELTPDYKANFQPTVDEMVSQGKWTLVKRDVYPNHYYEKTGILFMFRVC